MRRRRRQNDDEFYIKAPEMYFHRGFCCYVLPDREDGGSRCWWTSCVCRSSPTSRPAFYIWAGRTGVLGSPLGFHGLVCAEPPKPPNTKARTAVNIQGSDIETVDSFNYLGVHVKTKLDIRLQAELKKGANVHVVVSGARAWNTAKRSVQVEGEREGKSSATY